jgi:hypothetical protein
VRVHRTTKELESAFYRGLWGSLGDYGYLRNLTTNQEVASASRLGAATTITLTITQRGQVEFMGVKGNGQKEKPPQKGALGELPDLDSNQN